ncbi:protein FLX-like 1 [Malania oleifera]|uniref:protein FLX-like 1 n=1 Tax=Malania oleifera TaxID=397392 RepID=UPI0025ADDF5F|nr:protein FLX-like 1 [Malania oleifera]
MAGRNHLQPNALKRVPLPPHPALIEDPRLVHRVPLAQPVAVGRPHPAIIEERIAAGHREIQSLLIDNQRLAATHVALKQELAVAQQDLRHLSAAAANVKVERDAEVRDVYEKSLRMESEVRSIDALGAELAQVKMDVQKLTATKKELTAQLQAIDGDLARARADVQQLPAIKAEIENMHQELQRGRAAIEYEKKTHANNLEQSQAMKKNMISMAREIEKLRAELANAEKRARAAVAAAAANPSSGYAASYGNPDMGYGGSPYPDPYGMYQVQGGGGSSGDGGPYGSGTVTRGHYDVQRTHVHR